MRVRVSLQRNPLPFFLDEAPTDNAGAVVEFTGLVRAREAGETIRGLRYEAYESMAVSEMERILNDLASAHPCHSAEVIHRLGDVPVREAAIRIRITATHRREALAMMESFLDRLKRDVPIWKTGVLQ